MQFCIYFQFSIFNFDFLVKLILIEFRQYINILEIIFETYYIDKNSIIEIVLSIILVVRMFLFLFILKYIAIKTSIIVLLQYRKYI